ncbi:MAG: extracellular solute-binding protein [Treponema sp.]|nr:extracellular solute-binding protein [Treponema sp.]
MNEKLKNISALSLAALALMAVLAGCAKKESASGSSAAAPAENAGPVTIDLWYGAAVTEAGPPPADWKALQIIKDKLNIDLKLTALPSSENDQDVKINAAGAGNNLPDLFMVRRPVWLKLVQQGLVAPVDDLYAKMPVRSSKHYDAESRAFTSVDGVSYGLASPGSIIKNEGVLIRKDWLDRLGLSVPKTTDELMTVMKAFTFNDPDGNKKNDTYGYGAFIEIHEPEEGLGRRLDPIMGAFGVAGTWNMTKANAGLNVLKPEYFDGLSFVKQMCDEGVIDPNWTSYKKDDFRAAWKQGRFGIMREQNAAFAAKSNYAPFDENFPDGEWIVIDPPAGPNGASSVGVYMNSYRIYAVSQDAADAGKLDAIARLLEWMSSDEGYYLLGWGEKDVNFVLDAEGVPSKNGLADASKAFDQPDIVPITQLRNMVYYNSDIEIKARYPSYTTAKSGKQMSAGTVLRDMQSRQWTANNGADTLPLPSTDLKRFYEQGVLEFMNGKRAMTRDSWNAWIEEFKKMGGEKWNNDGVAFAKDNNLLY